ncbi:hypothetical protein LO763_05455 [Glycomyces sp. A-F 0318]|uniref:hypothetical protein n=1 Tax=Glycomyces amatae TaxID=2881355 RepID=UPI001E6395F4|nr:hypothetical protein [Glycomyces amatae]MCD0443073.1 hypothetical protein [Glycomyces amatae]
MTDAPDERMTDGEIAAVASTVEGVLPHYSADEEGMRKLASHLRWEPADPAEWPRDGQGRPAGVVCALPGGGRKVTVHCGPSGVVAPLSRISGDAAAQAAEFRRVYAAVHGAVGFPDFFGTYTRGGAKAPSWGTPYVRWRGKYTTLALRAGVHGTELVLDYTDIWEEDYVDAVRDAPNGFIGSVVGDKLMHVSGAEAADWDECADALAGLFAALPAETAALGVRLALGLYGTVTQSDGTRSSPFMFDIRCQDHLHIGYDAPAPVAEAARGGGAAALGWRPTTPEALQVGTEPEHFDSPWHFDGGGPGAARAREAAELIVATARAAGVREAGDLRLGGEAERIDKTYFRFPGLRMATV